MFDVVVSPISKRLVQMLTFGLFLFICGFFLYPTVNAHKTGYYLTVVLPFLLLTPWLRWRKPDKTQASVLLFVGYLVLASLWSPDFSLESLLYFLKCALLILILLWGINICVTKKWLIRYLLPSFIVSGCAVGIYSFWDFSVQSDWMYNETMRPVWHFANENRMAKVYGVLAMILLFVYRGIDKKNYTWIVGATFILSVLIVLFSRSTGGLLSLLASVPCLFFLIYWVEKKYLNLFKLFLVSGLLMLFALLVLPLSTFGGQFLEQGWSYRDEIWIQSWSDILQNPIFGMGAHSDLVVKGYEGRIYSHEHNVFVAVSRQSGLIGFLVMLVMLGRLFVGAISVRTSISMCFSLIFIFGLIALSSSGEYPLERPKESWLYFWLPIAFLMSLHKLSENGQVDMNK